ncbi:MAG: flagellar basal body L-ring protein FlgH [Chthonomonas sp.]|nr:flagellar basal body L-ring protein FlgH [Chthonomonas sp.]
MKKLNFWMLAIGLLSLSHAQVIDKNTTIEATGSLWSDSKGNAFVDRTARSVGDVITIIISETSVANFTANTNLNKQDNNRVSLNLFKDFLTRIIGPQVSSDQSSNTGGGTTTQNSKLTAKLTGVVREVLPNGNLIVEATRSLVVNKEIQTFKLSGVIRRDDVMANNTVRSELIAEADIRMEGKGAIHERQRRGLVTRLLDWLF